MTLLVEDLENFSLKIKELKERILELNNIYNQCFDRDVRKEMVEKKLQLKKLKLKLKNTLYINLEELRLIKENFPEFFKELEKDPFISSPIKNLKWLLNFEKLPKAKAEEKIKELKNKRKELRKAKKEITSFVEPNYNSLKKYKQLEDLLKKKPGKNEILDFIIERDKKLKKKGWLVMLNEPFIRDYVQFYLAQLTEARSMENSLKLKYKEASRQGSRAESDSLKEYMDAKKQRKHILKKLSHMLHANPEYLGKIKSSGSFNSEFTIGEYKFFDLLKINKINKNRWKEQMKKLLSL